MNINNNFLPVALAARERGFVWVTPVRDKKPRLNKYNVFCRTKTLTELRNTAEEFPTHEVGIVMRRGKEFMCWDIDNEGVLERCQEHARSIGETFPETYVVLSRPKSAPYKRHVFFRQTELSRQTWRKEVHVGDYDIVGIGGGGQVVAEGCVRDNGEVRTGNGLPPVPIPDWLVKWLDEDQRRLRQDIRRARQKVDIEINKAIQENSIIPRGSRTRFLQRRAYWLVKFNMERKRVYVELIRQCRLFCEGGIELTETPDGRRKIHDIAFDRNLKAGNPAAFVPRERTTTEVKGLKIAHLDPKEARMTQVLGLPERVTSKEAYQQLGLNPRVRGDQAKLRRSMIAGGFVRCGGRRGETLWARKQTTHDERECVVRTLGAPTDSVADAPSQTAIPT